MQRFYKSVTIKPHEKASSFSVLLDEKPVKTPARQPLQVPHAALAKAIAAEWAAQGDEIIVEQMPLTQVSATALDRVAPDANFYARQISAYGETDLVCYRTPDPTSLADRQAEAWQPLVDWASEALQAPLTVTDGITPVSQPEDSLAALQKAVAAHDMFEMAALGLATAASGSLIVALALSHGRIDARAAFEAGSLDETWQIEQWGTDEEVETRLENARADLLTAESFLELYRNP